MSGGERKKRQSRGQGWEEAGAEFYQESYPADVDLDVLQRDPSHLATLLPSKQSRAATAKRVRTDIKPTLRRRTSTRSRYHSTGRRTSTAHDVQVAMMPDLSENLSNEEKTWEEIMQIKAMPISMAQKKELKAKLQSATKLRLQGFDQFQWQRRKFWQQFKTRWKETRTKMELWRSSLKVIEGNFGTGVVAYFLFIKWLMYLNLCIFLFSFFFIILPTVLLESHSDSHSDNTTDSMFSNQTLLSLDVLNIIQGSGWMKDTVMFYGYYLNETYSYENNMLHYNFPLAYIAVTISYFIISLFAIIRSTAKGFKERLIEGEGQFYQYCNLVFGGWDYCIHNEKSAVIKHKALYNEIKGSLEAEKLEEERQNRSREELFKLISVRSFINLIVVAVLVGAGYLIFTVFNVSHEFLNNSNNSSQTTTECDISALFYEYLPSITIVGLNLIVPFLFNYLVSFEKYSPLFVVRINLLRTVFVRLSSLGVLIGSFYNLFVSNKQENLDCWETYVGQQLYKLVILDFIVHVIITFLVNFPRMFIAKHTKNKAAKLLGAQEFELPKHVLDIVYSQTLCWLGSFYAPLLPGMIAIECFFLFYIKKFACLVNSTPSSTVYRASRSNSLFMVVLLISFVLTVIPVAFAISEISPSDQCGPFRNEQFVWNVVMETFNGFPLWLQDILYFLSTAGFAVPIFILLALLLYYYYAVSAANKQMVAVLKNQLILEGHDKQFLLNRLSAFIKQQQQIEQQKAMRHNDMIGAGISDGN